MADALCRPCRERGITRKAHRLVKEGAGYVPKCDECFRGIEPEEKTNMKTTDWDEIAKDRAAGMTVGQVAAKRGISAGMIYYHESAERRKAKRHSANGKECQSANGAGGGRESPRPSLCSSRKRNALMKRLRCSGRSEGLFRHQHHKI
jgi:hypothetical protein